MKRVVRASESDGVIFEDDNFALVVRHGHMASTNQPWTGLEVQSKGLAYEHVVQIRLNRNDRYNREEDGTLIFAYDDAVVAHGMRSRQDSLEETEEYIDVLEDALVFARRVNAYLDEQRRTMK